MMLGLSPPADLEESLPPDFRPALAITGGATLLPSGLVGLALALMSDGARIEP
jgi:hypothetical protein